MILLRYLMLEIFKSQVGILFVLLLIFVSQKFIGILAKAIKGSIPTDIVMTLLYLNLPALAILMLPISFYLAILFALGRLHSESEMVAMTSCGFSPNSTLKSALLLSIFTFVFASYNTLYLAPTAEEKMVSIIENAESDAGAATLIEGRFHETSANGGVVYVEKYEKGQKLQKVFAAHWPENKLPSILTAASGSVEERKDGIWVSLFEGQRYAGHVGQNVFDVSEFERFDVHIASREVENKTRGVSALTTSQLMGVDDPKYQAELQWRIALPLSILILTFMAVPLARVNPREGRYAKILPALALYLSYFLLLSTAKSLIEDATIPALSLWVVQIVFFSVGIILHLQSLGKYNSLSFRK